MSSKVSSGRFTARKRTLASVAVVKLCLGVASPASAVSGTKTCPGQYGWLTAVANPNGYANPPGGSNPYYLPSPSTYVRVARDSLGNSVLGGGAWSVTSSGTTSGTPDCRNYG